MASINMEDRVNICEQIESWLHPAILHLIKSVAVFAVQEKLPLYFVGGMVRDLLLGQPAKDVDLLVEGDAIYLAKLCQEKFDGQLEIHDRFGTANWVLPSSIWSQMVNEGEVRELFELSDVEMPATIDFATARSESYAQPTHLPVVKPSNIHDDLFRRDFTINTLAVRLDGSYFGQLLDLFGGRQDLQQKKVRVLHDKSFIDDPTRILRAVRFEQRLGFSLAAHTIELMTASLALLNRVSGDRIRHEIELTLVEAEPAAVLQRLHEVGVLGQIHQDLIWRGEMAEMFAEVPALCRHPLWQNTLNSDDLLFIYFSLWLMPFPSSTQQAVTKRLKVRQKTRIDVIAVRDLMIALNNLNQPKVSQLTQLIRQHGGQRSRVLVAVLAWAQASGREKIVAWLETYQTKWQHIFSALKGDDLIAMGINPGPRLGDMLEQLQIARLDGIVHSRAEEITFLQKEWRVGE